MKSPLTLAQVAATLGYSYWHFFKKFKAGHFPELEPLPRLKRCKILIPHEAVENYLRARDAPEITRSRQAMKPVGFSRHFD